MDGKKSETERPTVRLFVSYAKKNEKLKQDLLERLEERLASASDIRFELWHDGQIEMGARWHDAIRAALDRCDFGLLLLSYPFLNSGFIADHELPPLVAEEKALPVGLSKVALDGSANLRGLEERQIFRDGKGQFFSELTGNLAAKEAFAEGLFQKILGVASTRLVQLRISRRPPPPPTSRPPPPAPPFLDTIQSHLRHELERELLAEVAKRLQPAAEAPAAAAAEYLVRRLEPEPAIQALSDAVLPLLHTWREQGKVPAPVWVAAVKTLLGWLLLRCVDEAWLERNRAQFEGASLQLRLPLRTHIGVELLVARNGVRAAGLKANPSHPSVFGQGGIAPDIPEWGIEPGFGVEELKRAIWRAVFHGGTPPTLFTRQHDEDLDANLDALARNGRPYYLTIPNDGSGPAGQEALFRQLVTDLPHLPAIFLGTGDGEAILVNERRLQATVRVFLLELDGNLPRTE